MKKQSSYLLIAGLAIIVLYGLYYFLRDEPIAIPNRANNKADSAKMLLFSGNKMVEQKDGKTQWEVTAESIAIDPQTRKALLNNLTAVLYQKDGSKITLHSKLGTMEPDTRDIIMTGDVRVDSVGQAVKLTVTELKWSSAQRRLYGTGNVKVTRDDTVITADFLEADELFHKTKVWGNAHIVKGVTQ